MGQKCSDLETIPLSAAHHREQHRIGLRRFCRTYDIDVNYWIARFTLKPRFSVWEGRYIAHWNEQVMSLTLVEFGLTSAWLCFQDRAREILRDEIREHVREFARR